MEPIDDEMADEFDDEDEDEFPPEKIEEKPPGNDFVGLNVGLLFCAIFLLLLKQREGKLRGKN